MFCPFQCYLQFITMACYPGWDNPYRNEFYWVSGILLIMTGVFGLIGNLINIFVLIKTDLRKVVFYKLLASLACYDVVFILSYGFRIGYESVACQPAINLFDYVTDSLLQFSYAGSVYSTLAISIERFVGIVFPLLVRYYRLKTAKKKVGLILRGCFQYSFLRSKRRARIYIASVFMLTLGVTFPLFIKYRFEWDADGKLVIELREWSSSTAWLTYYQVILTSTTLNLAPLFVCDLVGAT